MTTRARTRTADAGRAREAEAGAEGLLSTLTTMHGEVAAVRRATPNLLEVTLRGFAGCPLVGGDQFVYAMVATADSGLPPSYDMEAFLRRQPGDGVLGAYYTVRRFRPAAGEIDLWAVDHGHEGSVGEWFAHAQPGSRIALWGPRTGYEVPGDARHVLLVADETGFAAVAALLESLPVGCRATAVLETIDARHRPPLPQHVGLDVVWVDRHGDAPGATNRLLAAVCALGDTPDTAFGAGESRQITAVRRHVRDVCRVPAARVSMTGYWRLGGVA